MKRYRQMMDSWQSCAVVILLTWAAAIMPLQAATVDWTVSDITGLRTDVITTGTLHIARSCEKSSNRTVNGVTFLARDNSTNLFNSLFRWDSITTRRGTAPSGSWQDDYANFMGNQEGSGDYYKAVPSYAWEVYTTENWAQIAMTNLTVGNTYHVQIWRTDTDTTVGNAKTKGLLLPGATGAGDPAFSIDRVICQESADNGASYGYAGQYGIGIFVAGTTTEIISVRKYKDLLTTPAVDGTTRHPVNGFQVRDLGVDNSAPSPAPTILTLTPAENSVDIAISTDTTDQTGVEYQIKRRLSSGGAVVFTSNWQKAPSYTDTGLAVDTEYFYTVTARDRVPVAFGGPYVTAESAEVSTTTLGSDTTPPTPATMSFSSAPAAVDLRTITMTAVEATDDSGVEYQFVRRLGIGGSIDFTSAWQASCTFTDTGLDPATEYSYTVQARDTSAANNSNTVSAEAAATTDTRGTASIWWAISNITGNVSDVITTGTLAEARNGNPTAAATVNGVLFDTANNVGDLMDNVTNNDNIGNRGWGSVTTDSNYQNMLKYGQRAAGYDPATAPWTTIEFLGLTIGNTYKVQIWSTDNGNTAGDTALVLGDGGTGDPVRTADTTLLREVVEGGAGQYAVGTFVANQPNQAFNVRGYTALLTVPSGNTSGHFCNGWQLRDLGLDETAPSPAPTIASLTSFETSVDVEASTATTDDSGVEYQFVRRLGVGGSVEFTSVWQDSTSLADTGLLENTIYSYTVKARDKTLTPNETSESAEVSTTTLSTDNTPPTPATMSFTTAPTALDYQSITMIATEASDVSGVEYQFVRRLGVGGSVDYTSAWQDSRTFTDTGLDPATEYSYTVQARDKSAAANSNAVSGEVSATTDAIGTAAISWVVSDIADDVNDVITDGTLVEARTGRSGSTDVTVNGVTFAAVLNSANLFDSLYANDSIGARGYGSVVSDSSYRTFLQYGQRSGRVGFSTYPQIEPTEDWATVILTNLTVGSRYQFQIWCSDVTTDGVVSNAALVVGNGSGGSPQTTDVYVYLEASDGGAGQYVIGTFVANARNQFINVRQRYNLNSSPAWKTSDHFSNGWQLREVPPPEPTLFRFR